MQPVKHGQVSRAREELIGAALAPKTLDTLAKATSSRMGSQDPSRGVGESPQACGFGFVFVRDVSGQ